MKLILTDSQLDTISEKVTQELFKRYFDNQFIEEQLTTEIFNRWIKSKKYEKEWNSLINILEAHLKIYIDKKCSKEITLALQDKVKYDAIRRVLDTNIEVILNEMKGKNETDN